MIDLNGKVAIITGVSRGIGRATALRFAQSGAKVVGCYMQSQKEAYELEDELRHYCEGHKILQADVSDLGNAQRLCQTAFESFGKIDIVVANAGVNISGSALTSNPDSILRLFLVNTFAAMELSRLALKQMILNRWGRLIFIGSAASDGMANHAAYAASKAALTGWSNSLAQEMGSKGITSNVIAPGCIDTKMQSNRPEKERTLVVNAVAVRRMGSADEVASLAAYLSSEAAAYITGTVLSVDGGARFS